VASRFCYVTAPQGNRNFICLSIPERNDETLGAYSFCPQLSEEESRYLKGLAILVDDCPEYKVTPRIALRIARDGPVPGKYECHPVYGSRVVFILKPDQELEYNTLWENEFVWVSRRERSTPIIDFKYA
jgi:hypothetical protein